MSGRNPPLYCTLILVFVSMLCSCWNFVIVPFIFFFKHVLPDWEPRSVIWLRPDRLYEEHTNTLPTNSYNIPVYVSTFVCVCAFFPFILDIKFVGRTSRSHTGGRSHNISHPPSFCGACLNFSCEKGSAIPFPCRPWNFVY